MREPEFCGLLKLNAIVCSFILVASQFEMQLHAAPIVPGLGGPWDAAHIDNALAQSAEQTWVPIAAACV